MHEYYYTIIVEYSNQGTKRLDSFVTPFTNERTSQECRPRSACQDQIKRFENRFQRTFFAGNFIIIIIIGSIHTLESEFLFLFFRFLLRNRGLANLSIILLGNIRILYGISKGRRWQFILEKLLYTRILEKMYTNVHLINTRNRHCYIDKKEEEEEEEEEEARSSYII